MNKDENNFKSDKMAVEPYFIGVQKNEKNKPQPTYRVACINFLCQKLEDMANTGRQLCYKWSYRQDGQVISTCQLIKSMSGSDPVYYTEQEVKALSDEQYATAFGVTRNYMQNTLAWTVLPNIGESNKQNLTVCPIDSGGGGGVGGNMQANIEMKIDVENLSSIITYETVTVEMTGVTQRVAGVSGLTPTSPVQMATIYGFEFSSVDPVTIQVDSTIGNMFYLYNESGSNMLTGVTGTPTSINNGQALSHLITDGVIRFHIVITV